ncbi:MAG: hypothetical protein ACK515_04400 [bacterium]|jgi:hypothetical protein|nr:hypothetical protein [Betaproteobacteria bacterium]
MRYVPIIALMVFAIGSAGVKAQSYRIPGTGQDRCLGAAGQIACPAPGTPCADAEGTPPIRPTAYRANGDGTVTDLVTSLIWAEAPSAPVTLEGAARLAAETRLGGHRARNAGAGCHLDLPTPSRQRHTAG